MTADEIWEECICDFLGDINIFSKSANGSLVVNELINQTQAIVKEQKAEPNQTRGSPDAEGKASREKYTYNALINKNDLLIITLPTNIPLTLDGKVDKKEIIAQGRLNAKKQNNPNNTVTETYVRIDDVGLDVLLSKNALEHGIPRSEETALAVMKIGDVLKNSIAVNELNGSDERKTQMSYVLLGACKDTKNLYVVRSVVSKMKNEVTEIDIYQLGAVKGKKIEPPTSTQGGTAVREVDSLISSGVLDISISDFLEYVKSIPIANEIFSEDVSKELGITRTQGTLSQDVRYSRELDTDYLDAVKSGDIETAQKMVDEAAKNWGAITNDKGKVMKFYHGTEADFNVFSYESVGKATGVGILGDGFYFTDKKRLAKDYGQNIRSFYLQMSNPYSATENDFYRLHSDKLSEAGYDGVVFKAPSGNITMVFDNTQMKLTDPVTYADDGNVIPLSERFNSENNDIRYSRELDALDYITPDEEFEEVETQAFSNRTLLANALLDTITSSEEYKLIRSYQEEIAQLDKSDKRLAQLKKDRNQLYKQEKPNFEVIRELNEKDYTICAKYTKKTLKKQGKTLKNHLVKLYRFML